MKAIDRASALRIIKGVLKADLACEDGCFNEEGISVVRAREMDGRRRFPFRDKALSIVTMGKGAIVSCSADRTGWVKENLGSLARDQLFSAPIIARLEGLVGEQGQFMAGPDLKYVCSMDTFGQAELASDVAVELVEQEDVHQFYRHDGFPHALSYERDSGRPDVLASVAVDNGKVVGIAGASADCDEMWQVGIEVIPASRGLGIGRVLVGVLTQAIMERGKVPYYSAAVSNIASRSLAKSLGYWAAWTELYARDRG